MEGEKEGKRELSYEWDRRGVIAFVPRTSNDSACSITVCPLL